MALNPLIDSRDVRFVLFELLGVDKLGEKYREYADYSIDTLEEFLELAEKIAVEQVYPSNMEGDKKECTWDPETKQVAIPDCYKTPLNAYYEAGFIGVSDEPEFGGMGMPYPLGMACNEYLIAGNVSLMMYPGLSHGAMQLIKHFGSNELKNIFVEKMMNGKWGGTMCLTEANAGSDVGQLKSKAVKNDDGTYSITGQNIFISSGENDYYENMIHLKLARVEGDPSGTRGLSIFVVPKYRVNPDGSIGDFNDVICAGIEHKLGIKGSATATLSFGENGNCRGYLLGEERQGIKIMFHMMNEERLLVGCQGLACSSTAYLHAVTYAKNRIQGVHVTQMLNPEAKPVTISQHPDIKRMLLWMKSYVEGMRIFSYFLGYNLTVEKCGSDDEKKPAKAIGDFLRPVLKAGNTDTAVFITSEAIQTYGGYGFCSDYPVEQLMRDAKILTIYEGTNGIQSMDFTMRKTLLDKDQYSYNQFKKVIENTIAEARGIVNDRYVDMVEKGMVQYNEVIEIMKTQMNEGKYLHLFMNATPLQQAMFMLCIAWAHLWSLTVTLPKMKNIVGDLKGEERDEFLGDNKEAAYYNGRVLSAQFYIMSEFPKFFGRIDILKNGESAVIKASDPVFTGALEE